MLCMLTYTQTFPLVKKSLPLSLVLKSNIEFLTADKGGVDDRQKSCKVVNTLVVSALI